tara:strand:+ start:3754 stop:4071 length:318 start_codon:yes stop_codon:yes gene_type:complete
MSSESSSNKDKSLAELCEEIYKNSADDREKASMLITDLWKEITTDPEKHALYGTTISKYFERMAKSNDQLLKLAEIMQKNTETEEESLEIDDVYDKITLRADGDK